MPTANPEMVFNFLKRAHYGFQHLSKQLSFDKEHPRQRNVVALYGSMIELTGSLIILVENKLITGVPVLLRSILEAHIDLHNLAENATYGYSLELSYIKEWLKILQEAKAGKNEYLISISSAPSLDASISDWQKKKQQLEAKGYRPLRIEQKFQRAGMEKEYRSIYNSLCADAHNNLRSLIDRHIELGQGSFEVVFYKAYTPEDSEVNVGMNAELLVRASEKIHQFLGSAVQEQVAGYRSELDGLRGGD